jgi:hypothetical protein
MSYQERKTIVSLISGLLVVASYCIYAFGRYQSGAVDASDLKFWASTILIFIGIGVVASIVIQIVFHILMSVAIAVQQKMRDEAYDDKEIEKTIAAEMVEDEMDKLIELKSMRFGFFVAGIGFVAALVSLVLGYSAAVMLNILFLSFSGGALLEGFVQLYFYRKGVTNA